MTEYRKVFVDTAPLIYLLEDNQVYYSRIEKLFSYWYKTGSHLITSAITVEEYCVYPYKQGRADLIENFDLFLSAYGIDVYRIDSEIAKKAAIIRSQFAAFKAMDALQLSTAVINRCDCFLTNDKQLSQYREIDCLVVNDLV